MLTGLNHITLAVRDIERSLEFYCRVLGFVGRVKWKTGAYLTLEDVWLCLSLDDHGSSEDYSHIAFSVEDGKFSRLAEKIAKENIPEWKSNVSEGASLYILDPDQHKLELHSGSLESRLESLKSKPYDEMVWL
ncbi:MAG: VOC family protein [Cellvibrionaceae bacterium]